MIKEEYRKQVELLLKVIPEIAKEDCFALHGGTAINLFIRDMPRLSVDIDLTYLPLEDYDTSLKNIGEALQRIKVNIEKVVADVKVDFNEKNYKLYIMTKDARIKVEANTVTRGSLHAPVVMDLCVKAQEEFEVLVSMKVIPKGQLFGGKICAALDRQHPRDLFDIHHLLNAEGITPEIKEGFLFCLVGHSRPINEVILPNWQDQKSAMENQFEGMSVDGFTYDEYEQTREALKTAIHASLTEDDKIFLLSIKDGNPDWAIYDFQKFPSVRRKIEHINKLKGGNAERHEALYTILKKKLYPEDSEDKAK